jgi:hypothetical protein
LFDGEPIAWRLRLQRDWTSPGATLLNVAVDELPDVARAADETGKELFSATCDFDIWGHAVAEAAEAVWREHGADGYNRLWDGPDHSFPLRALTALKTALGAEEAPRPSPEIEDVAARGERS